MYKKLIALLLVLIIAVSLVACGKETDDGAPEGMKSTTVAGEPFILYVPTTWTDNTASGVSGAYYMSGSPISVSARYYTPDPSEDLGTYMGKCISSAETDFSGSGYTFIESKANTQLGAEPALRNTYTIVRDDITLRCVQITADYGADFISLYIYCPEDQYEVRFEDFERIRKEFKFRVRNANNNGATDENTPAGMQRASAEGIEYMLYVPLTWKCNSESGASEAYFPGDNANILVTSYVPRSSMSVDDYFKDCEKQLKEEIGEENYTFVSGPEIRVNPIEERNMHSYVFEVTVDGSKVKIMQTIIVFNNSFYTITYTARAEDFGGHLEDVYKILDNFRFM